MHRFMIRASGALLLLALFWACRPERRPIAGLRFEPAILELPYPQHRTVRVHAAPVRAPYFGGCPRVFVHLIDDATGRTVRTFDHLPPGWPLGETIRYELKVFQSALAEPLAPGTYRLAAGLYSPQLRQRCRFEAAGKVTRLHTFARLSVPEADLPALRLSFREGWEDATPGDGLQVPMRRWFDGAGTLHLAGKVSETLRLRLVLDLPKPPFPEDVERSDVEPSVAMTSSCGGEPSTLAPGLHEIELELSPGPLVEGCGIDLRANYSFHLPGWPGPRSGSLESVSWAPRP